MFAAGDDSNRPPYGPHAGAAGSKSGRARSFQLAAASVERQSGRLMSRVSICKFESTFHFNKKLFKMCAKALEFPRFASAKMKEPRRTF